MVSYLATQNNMFDLLRIYLVRVTLFQICARLFFKLPPPIFTASDAVPRAAWHEIVFASLASSV